MNNHSQSPDIAGQFTHRQILIVFLGLMIGMLLASLDQTVVSTALPTIVGELGGLEHLSWVITAYLLTTTTSMPLYGKLSDIFGRKLLFQAAIVIFLVGSLLSGISHSMIQLILSRGVQGLGGGGIIIMAQAIIGDIVAPRERGRYQGYMGSVFAVSSIAGPLMGGFFTDNLTWRWLFFINIPIGAAALFVTATMLHVPFRRTEHRIDYLGAVLLVSGISALLLLTTWGGVQYAWGSPVIIGLGVAGAFLLCTFVFQEMRAEEPLLPLRLFRECIFSVGSTLSFIVGLGLFGAVAYLPLYFQVVRGTSATMSGLRLFPLMVGVITTSIGSGLIITRIGRYRIFPILGTGIMIAGMYLLSRLEADTSAWVGAAYMLPLGVGLGMVMQVPVLAVQNAVQHRDLGAATAGINLFRSLGSAFGVAIFGAILNNRLSSNLNRLLSPEVVSQMGKRTLMSSPEQLRALPPAIHEGVIQAFAHSLHTVFLAAVPLMVIAFLVALMMRDIPLREQAHVGMAMETPPPLESEADTE